MHLPSCPFKPRLVIKTKALQIPWPRTPLSAAAPLVSGNDRSRLVPKPVITAPTTTVATLAAMSSTTRQTSVSKTQQRTFASKGDDKKLVNGNGAAGGHDHHNHGHKPGLFASPTHGHEDHTHGLFASHTHSHSHGTDAEKIFEALKGGGDAGSRITLIGLFANIGLTAAKGAAGWYMHSASLMADAGHSLSDLLGDFVTLFCWQLSRRKRSNRYPYGFGKFEPLGTAAVSLLLIGGALGIGFHSYHLLLETMYPAIGLLPPGLVQHMLQSVMESTGTLAGHVSHGHQLLDPNAAWFAAVSVVAKEYLYRITKKVADDEHSSVLMANAIHHRSDAWSSLVALVAILGTAAVPGLPLDPVGGLVVSVVIFVQGFGLLNGVFKQFTDAGVSDKTRESLIHHLDPLLDGSSPLRLPHLVAIRDLRALHSGAQMFVDLVAALKADTTVAEAFFVQEEIKRRLVNHRKEIAEVRIIVVPEDETQVM